MEGLEPSTFRVLKWLSYKTIEPSHQTNAPDQLSYMGKHPYRDLNSDYSWLLQWILISHNSEAKYHIQLGDRGIFFYDFV